jgi:hypothetical protein
MISKKPSHRLKKKKSVRQRKPDAPVSVSEVVAGLRHHMDSRWPNLGRRLSAVIRVSREKVDDFYCSAAQFVTEHKEAFDDLRAEKKAHHRAAVPADQQPGSPFHSVRASRNSVQKGTVTRSVRPSSVKKPKKTQQNRLSET